ncbi:S-adenosyl-L-methionine-dependent methyltransferase [Sparassis latifolia]
MSTPARPPGPQQTNVLAAVLSKAISIVVLISLSLTVFAYRHELEPIYGVAPTNLHLNKIVWLACGLGSFLPTLPLSYAVFAGGVLLSLLPNTAYWVAVHTARMGDPVWGPVATHMVVIVPILYLGVAIVKALQELPTMEDSQGAPQQLITLPICQTSIMSVQELWPVIPRVKEFPTEQIFLGLGAFMLLVWAITPLLPTIFVAASSRPTPVARVALASKTKSQRKKATAPAPATKAPQVNAKSTNLLRLAVLPVVPVLTATILRSPTLLKPLLEPYIHPSYPMRVLSTVNSPYSGVVVVGEALPLAPGDARANSMLHSVRYLRAGHSLLGGMWIGPFAGKMPTALDEEGEPLGESVYNAFVLQEAARLFLKPEREEEANALVIGLGTGISASAFMRHNMSTTIVEIDGNVYDAAKRFFALPEPEPGKLFIKDARNWVRMHRARLENATATRSETGEQVEVQTKEVERYDVIVHDCFSGGSVPAYLYTESFWDDTKAIMHPDGVLAVDFFGQLESDSSRAILHTLESVFGHCRAFSDSNDPTATSTLYTDALNWVFFCSPSSNPLTFRASCVSDFLGSPLRAYILSTFSGRELDLAPIRELPEKTRSTYLLTDMQNALVKWQEQRALEHWKIMREVLPDVFWETY